MATKEAKFYDFVRAKIAVVIKIIVDEVKVTLASWWPGLQVYAFQQNNAKAKKKIILTRKQRKIMLSFRGKRYDYLNNLRWDLFLKMGIPIADKVIFEPGAGIGDQTEWLLNQGVKFIYVNEGRPENMEIIKQRFAGNPRLKFVPGNLEDCLDKPEFNFTVDIVFLWGVYYHINDSLAEFQIMKSLSRIGPTIVVEYLENNADETAFYDYQNPSTSLSQYAIRPTTQTMMKGIKKSWSYAYLPKIQMDWEDPFAPKTPRRLAVGSSVKLENPNLLLQ